MNSRLVSRNGGELAAHLRRRSTPLLLALFRTVFIVGICFLILSPILTKISMSFMDQRDLYDRTVKSIPKHFTLSNYPEAIGLLDYWAAAGNTALLAGMSGLMQGFTCIVTGYGLARFQFKGRGLVFGLVIVSMVIPPQLILTPLYLNFQNFDPFGLISLFTGGRGLRLIESFTPFLLLSLTATAARNGLYIFLARQFFRGFPREIDEAASIDGAGWARVFFRIMLPGASSIFIVIFLFAFVWQWNDSMYTFLFYTDFETIAKALTGLESQFAHIQVEGSALASNIGYYSIMRATSMLLAILPLLGIYGVLQKKFILSIERTGIVG